MSRERLNLETETLSEYLDNPNWTLKGIQAWIVPDQLDTNEVESQVEVQVVRA
jgi:hypothetical protein